MVRSSRMRNFPAHIPASQSQTLPPQRREPASASATQIDILYLSFILSDFLIAFLFIRVVDIFIIFGDIIPYPDFEAIQPVRRSYLPHTY